MAETINLDNEHPDFAATKAARVKCRDLYGGSDVVKAKGSTYLYTGNNETDDDFDIRLNRAVLDPWVEKIVIARQALLFSKQPARELPSKLAVYTNDVDRKGSSVGLFFQDAARDAQIDGISWVAIDAPPTPEGGFTSRREQERANHRPFFEHLPGSAVIDWEIGDDGALLWAVVKQESTNNRGEEGWGTLDDAIEQWKVWTRSAWYLYERSEKSQKFDIVDEGINSSGVVPLVPFYGVRNGDFSGWPVCRAVSDHVLLIYNKDSDLDWFERITSHPIPYIIGPMKPETLDTSKGLFVKSDAGDGTISVGYLEPSGQGFQSIRDSIMDLRYRILSIALAQAKKDSGQVQSGDGQREDRKIFAASVRTASQLYEAAELRCWSIMAKWIGESGKVKIEYNRDFDDRMIDAQMLGAMTDLVSAALIPQRVFLQSLVDGGALPAGFDIEAAIAEYEENQARLPEPLVVPAMADVGDEDEDEA